MFLQEIKINIWLSFFCFVLLIDGNCVVAQTYQRQTQFNIYERKLNRYPLPIPEGEVFLCEMWKDWGLRPPQAIPDNLEDILLEREFWSLAEYHLPIRDGKLYFEFVMFGDSPQYALQFSSTIKDCTLHITMPDREDYHYTASFTKPLTVIFYDGHKVVVTEERIDRENLPNVVKAYILTPLTEGQFYTQINQCCYPIFGDENIYKSLLVKLALPLESGKIGKAELMKVKRIKRKNIN